MIRSVWWVCVHECIYLTVELEEGVQLLWSWSYRWTTWYRCREVNLDPLEEQCELLTTALSCQPLMIPLRQGLSVEPRPCPVDVLVGQIIQGTPFPPLSARISGEWPQPLSRWWVPRIHTQAQLLSTEPPPKSLDVSNLKTKHSSVIQPKGIPIWYLLCNDDKQMSEVVCSFCH